MRLRRFAREKKAEDVASSGFDSFDLRLGDLMRGERATLGKSLLDIERELRIKASFVAAIENCDPEAFDTPGFIPGYVRSYARYLGMDPDHAFATFCEESGFSTAHGMSADASSLRRPDKVATGGLSRRGDDPLMSPATPFIPAAESIVSRIEPGALGSFAVLVALIVAIGYGGLTVLNEVQQVQVSPIENTPEVLAELDPLQSAIAGSAGSGDAIAGGFAAPQVDNLDRLYRPEALDVPILVARDAPISTLNPAQVGTFLPGPATVADVSAIDAAIAEAISPQVVAAPAPGVQMVAVRPAWVRVRAADGTVIFEGIMNAGQTYDVPVTETPPTLRVGESGAIYFMVDGQHYGPAGEKGSVTANLALSSETLTENLAVADISQDDDFSRYVAELSTQPAE